MSEAVRFQHFEVLRREDGSLWELGRGAMGITYKAFDTNLRSFVALKVVNAAYLNSEVARQRFLREARAAAAIRHPNVATVFHLGDEDGTYFYAMEFVDGETVESWMKREGSVPTAMALDIVLQVGRALAAAEKQGLVHRDIKPSNLMLIAEDDGPPALKVIDFGLAKNSGKSGGEDTAALTLGGFLGTPHFASPEQLEERDVDGRSDIYSLGVTLWYMLAGKTPFSGSMVQVMSQHLTRTPPFEALAGQPPEVLALLARLMAKDAADRPQNPQDLRREVEACLAAVRAREELGSRVAPGALENEAFETTAIADVPPTGQNLLPGAKLVGRYEILEDRGVTDSGNLFKARSLEGGQSVAILLLGGSQLSTREAFTRLETEVEQLQRVREPAVQRVLSLERAEHFSFLVLEWVEGATLIDVLKSRRTLGTAELALLIQPLAAAFDGLLRQSLPCPELAPHKIILTDPGSLSLKLTEWKTLAPKFNALILDATAPISPEATVIESAPDRLRVSFAGNPGAEFVFVLASLVYEAAGGLRDGRSGSHWTPVSALTGECNAVLRQALDPEQSFPSAGDFAIAFAGASTGSVAPPATTPPPPPVAPPVAPHMPRSAADATPPARPSHSGRGVRIWTICATLIVLGAAAVWIGSGLSRSGRGAADVVVNDPSPTPVPSATPTPTPDDPGQIALEQARTLEQSDKDGPALQAYADWAKRYPERAAEAREHLEMIAARIRANSAAMSPANLLALRTPLEAAAEQGTVSAQMLLGESLRKTDPADALRWFMDAAQAGNASAMTQVGLMMSNGLGTGVRDLPGALEWFRKAEAKGDVPGNYMLAECYYFGKGTPKDQKRAAEILTKGWALNDPRSMALLGMAYMDGQGVPADPSTAQHLLKEASALGSSDAQRNLGILYIRGMQGMPPRPQEALAVWKAYAEAGNVSCMYLLGRTLLDGDAGIVDKPGGQKWIIQAAEAGDPIAAGWCKDNDVSFKAP